MPFKNTLKCDDLLGVVGELMYYSKGAWRLILCNTGMNVIVILFALKPFLK